MNFSQIVFLVTLLYFCTSCQNGSYKKREAEPHQNEAPATDYQNTNEPIPSLDKQRPIEKPLEKEVKKAKRRAIDTLKPLTAIP